MIVKQFTSGPLEDNNYLLIDEETKEAILIDCSQENESIYKALDEGNYFLKYILLTHGHFDHVLGVNGTKKRYDSVVLMHSEDQYLLDTMDRFVQEFGMERVDLQEIDGYIFEGDIIELGNNTKIEVIHTPGHTPGSVCFLVGDKIFTGDTLFYEAVGRTDLPGGSFKQLKTNIKEKLFTLDENIKVYPGHGRPSTIGHEKNNNNFE